MVRSVGIMLGNFLCPEILNNGGSDSWALAPDVNSIAEGQTKEEKKIQQTQQFQFHVNNLAEQNRPVSKQQLTIPQKELSKILRNKII